VPFLPVGDDVQESLGGWHVVGVAGPHRLPGVAGRISCRNAEGVQEPGFAVGAVVATLHDLNAAALYADRVLLLKDGIAMGWGTPEDVLTEEKLREVYETEVYVGRNPATGAIAVLPGANAAPSRR